MMSKRIEIVSSTIAGFSSMGASSRLGILDVLRKYYSSVEISIVNNIEDLSSLVGRRPDLVFLGMDMLPYDKKIILGDQINIWVSEYLDQNNIAYTGSAKKALYLESNKPLAKQLVINQGLKSSKFYVTSPDSQFINLDLKFPQFIKPVDGGGGKGVDADSVAHNEDQANFKVASILKKYNCNSLVEEYLTGREFSVSLLKNIDSDRLNVMPIELVATPDNKGNRMLSRRVKSSNSEEVLAVDDGPLKTKINNLAVKVFNGLGGRDYGRVDIRLDNKGEPFFLEANFIPSLIDGYGSFPKACSVNLGMSFEEMLQHIVTLGLARNENENSPRFLSSNFIPSTV